MFSTVFVGIIFLIRSPVSCASGSMSHKLPVYHKSSCIRHQLLRSYLPTFRHFGRTSERIASDSSRNDRDNFAEAPVKFHVKEFTNLSNNYTNSTSVPEGEERNANDSLQHDSLQLHSFIIAQPNPQTNNKTTNQIVRQSKCRNIHLLNSSCCDRTIEAPAKYDKDRNNETRSRCLVCTKTKGKVEKRKKPHKRLNKRETFKIYPKTELAGDESPMILDSLPIVKEPKQARRWSETDQKYVLYASFEDVEKRLSTKKRRQSNENVQLTDVELYQLADLLGYNTIMTSDGKSINVNQLCQQLTGLSVSHVDTIKRKFRCLQEEEIKPDAVYVNTIRDGFAKPCRHSSFNERARKTLGRSGSSEANSNDESTEPCRTLTEQTAPPEKTIAKKSQPPLNENTDTQSLVFTEFESCSHIIETKVIALPGCVAKSVLITRCHGNCQSSSSPAWDEGTQTIQQREHCTCCSAHLIKFRTLMFHCPSRTEGSISITMGFPFRCACRPCASVPEVRAEQPYDY